MEYTPISDVTTAGQATDIAIEWQNLFGDHNISMYELARWQDYFADLADKFPELKDEFEENGVI